MTSPTDTQRTTLFITLAYLLTVGALLWASLQPDGRVWGWSVWAYFPTWLIVAVIVVLAIRVPVMLWVSRREPISTWRIYTTAVVSTFALLMRGFILFATKTHYLGDGYALLDFLSSNHPLIKDRNWLESWVRVIVRDTLGGPSSTHAMLAFQLVSWIGGGIAVVLAGFWSFRLMKQPMAALLLFLGILSGGYSLMFFGYVENYSLFIPCVLWFTLFGLSAAQGKSRPWWIILLLAAAASLHIFGVTLVPAAAYLILSHKPIAKRLANLSPLMRWGTAGVILVAAVALFFWFWSTNQFFRYAFVPIFHDRVTVEGYTMFSAPHLLDVLNLLFLLVPGLLVLLLTLFFERPSTQGRDTRFVLLLILSTVGAAFIFDPKLGMPRDWDLFAFCGVPAAVGLYYLLLNYGRSHLARFAAIGAIGLGLVVLAGRVATQQNDVIAASRFDQYCALDSKKNMNFRKLVVDYYEQSGDIERASLALKDFYDTYPEWNLNRQGLSLMDRGDAAAAIPLYRQAIAENPVFTAAYSNLAMAYAQEGQLDSAEVMASIARGFNPLGPRIAVTLGQIALRRNQLETAEQYFLDARKQAPNDVNPLIGLAMVARMRGDESAYANQMVQTLRYDRVPSVALRGFANFLAVNKQYAAAVRVYQKAMENGMSREAYEALLASTPPLKQAADSLIAATGH